MLKLYLEIGKTGNYRLLAKEGSPTVDECYKAWEEVVMKSNKAAGSNEFQSYIDDLKTLNLLLNEYKLVRAMILYLFFVVDDETIAELANRGYKIDTSGATAYAKSLGDRLQNSNNLISKVKSKAKKIAAVQNRKGEKQDSEGYDSLIVRLTRALGFQVDENNLTLVRYNEYKKQIEQEQTQKKLKHGRNQPQ